MDKFEGDITSILHAMQEGDQPAHELLWNLLYNELHRIAKQRIRRERKNLTLSTTGLVHEAYLKLIGPNKKRWRNRQQFYAFASTVMRQILIDHARKTKAQKNNNGQKPEPLLSTESLSIKITTDILNQDDLIDLNDALVELEALNPRWAKVVECRYFGGMKTDEIALVIGYDKRTVERDWKRAKNFLYNRLTGFTTDSMPS